MRSIGKFLILVSAIAFSLAATPRVAGAQLDHLVCYKVADKLAVKATVDMFAELQPEFSARGCVVVKADEFCVPATKLNVQPAASDVRSDIVGPALSVDYIGYLIKCRQDLAPSGKVVVDQFGVHKHLRYKIERIYVPAKKGPPPCGSVNGKLCGGTCPDATDQCRVDTDGACKCVPPVDNTCGGKPDKQGQCGGPCPNPGDTCQVSLSTTGAKVCACGPPPPPRCSINAATGTCGGDCPLKAQKCVLKTSGECTCAPATTPCALQPGTVPVCGGDCPVAGDVCSLAMDGTCACGPPDTPAPCDQNPLTGMCGGDCPVAGEKCLLNPAGTCACGPVPCGSDANGQCTNGACPNAGQTCKLDASGACNCDPPSCGVIGANTCGGLCPGTLACAPGPVGAAFNCRCQ